MVNILVLILTVLMGLAGSVNAAGFRLAEQDAKATGMGNAFTAVADNASAVWYNPAAITSLEGTNVSLGTVMVMPTMEHKNTSGTTDEIKKKTHIPPHFYATRKLNDNLSLGFGVNVPFGLSTEWEKTSATKNIATKSEVKAVNYNLNGAFKANEKLSFALGLDYATVDATLNQMNPYVAGNEIKLEGDGHGMGYNAAMMYKATEKMKVGVNYHSKVKAKLEGDLAFSAVFTGKVKTELTLPDMLQIGVSHQCTDKWLFSLEADYTDWTTYRNIIIKKQSDGTLAIPGTISVKNWRSAWAYRLGTEYKYSDTLKLRAGTFYDNNPVKDKYFETRVPDTDRIALSVGAGWNKGNFTVDASYMYLMFKERKVTDSLQDGAANTLNGKYNSAAHLPAITLGYKF